MSEELLPNIYIEKLNGEMTELLKAKIVVESRLAFAEKILAEKDALVNQIGEAYQKMEEELKTLRESQGSFDSKVNELNESVAGLKLERDRLDDQRQNELKDKDIIIQRLRGQIADLNAQNEELKTDNNNQAKAIESLMKDQAKKEAKVPKPKAA